MGRAPVYTLAVLPQVTLHDVYSGVESFGLDVDDFIAKVLASPSGDRDTDFLEAFTWSELEEFDVSDTWKKFAKENARSVAHADNKAWTGRQQELRSSYEYRDVRLLQPVGVRTLTSVLQKTGWDYERMPSTTVGAGGTLDALVADVAHSVYGTIGGAEYLRSDEETPARALTVLATTLAAVLLDEAASITDARLRARILRADIYEGAARGAALGKHFQVIRRLLELHHDEHLRVPVNGPGSAMLDFGFIEYSGRSNQYMKVNVAAAKSWLKPASYR
jgi:hypothetical protein